ncbi:MAG: hypothetical protein O8C63_02335 [Candidatus Methanoperedens sp.]|nr:hypothetical protein [Candidatus Methanoperedens sp.]
MPKNDKIDDGIWGPTQTINNTIGRNINVAMPTLTLNLYNKIPITIATKIYNIDDAATPGPYASPAATVLNVCAVISVNAMIT